MFVLTASRSSLWRYNKQINWPTFCWLKKRIWLLIQIISNRKWFETFFITFYWVKSFCFKITMNYRLISFNQLMIYIFGFLFLSFVENWTKTNCFISIWIFCSTPLFNESRWPFPLQILTHTLTNNIKTNKSSSLWLSNYHLIQQVSSEIPE